jgi:hypothetical protein
MADPGDGGAWAVTTASVDLAPFWRRHLRAQIRLYASVTGHGDDGRAYRSAVVWALTTFLHGLQDCTTAETLRQRASQTSWWDARCRSELGCPSLLALRVGDVPLSGHSLAGAALALRQIELAQYVTVDPTTVLDAPPSGVLAWLREP